MLIHKSIPRVNMNGSLPEDHKMKGHDLGYTKSDQGVFSKVDKKVAAKNLLSRKKSWSIAKIFNILILYFSLKSSQVSMSTYMTTRSKKLIILKN